MLLDTRFRLWIVAPEKLVWWKSAPWNDALARSEWAKLVRWTLAPKKLAPRKLTDPALTPDMLAPAKLATEALEFVSVASVKLVPSNWLPVKVEPCRCARTRVACWSITLPKFALPAVTPVRLAPL